MKNVISVVDNYLKIKDFYPDDMPEDWCLDYYLNEFDAVFIDNTISSIVEQYDENIDDLLEERESPISVVIEGNVTEGLIEEKTSLITNYFIVNKNTNTQMINSTNKQGVDSLAIILIDFSQFENLKKLSQFCQEKISRNKTMQTILIMKTPCSIKQIKDFEILLNLIF